MRSLWGCFVIALMACSSSAPTPVDAGAPPPYVPRSPDRSTMVLVPASTFSMGTRVQDPGDYGQDWKENEFPAHDVTLPDYYLDRDEVTAAEYAEFLNAVGGPVHWHPLQPILQTSAGFAVAEGAGLRPITLVSWYDAVTFCAWAGKRLPTEAEWERAARGPDGRAYPWGNDGPSCQRATYLAPPVTPCADAPRDVGSHGSSSDSAEGCRDLAGNVAEWTQDVYGRYSNKAQTDPMGPNTGPHRVVRGGGYHDSYRMLRAAARVAANPADRSAGVGFRCALRP
jgi:formylglycine-generating enzyme required for sulfatase activity